MSSPFVIRPALGQRVKLGNLYDARTDTFIPASLFQHDLTPDMVQTMHMPSTDITITKGDTYLDKFGALGIVGDLAASFLAGFVEVSGSSRYLLDNRQTNSVIQSCLRFKITALDEEIDFSNSSVKEMVASDALKTDGTHIVTKISWGSECIVSARRNVDSSRDLVQISTQLENDLAVLKSAIMSVDGAFGRSNDDNLSGITEDNEFAIFSDAEDCKELASTNFIKARDFVRALSERTLKIEGWKGDPLVYTLMPVSLLGVFGLVQTKDSLHVPQLDVLYAQKIPEYLYSVRRAWWNLNDYYIRLQDHAGSVEPKHAKSTKDVLDDSAKSEATLKRQYAEWLKKFRSGNATTKVLDNIFQQFFEKARLPGNIMDPVTYTNKLDFVDLIRRCGVNIVDYNSPSLEAYLYGTQENDVFVLYYNELLRTNSDLWQETLGVFLDLLRDSNGDRLGIAVDCDAVAVAKPLEKPLISHIRKGRTVAEDVIEKRKTLAANCIMRCSESRLDCSIKNKPPGRRAVRMPCPQTCCEKSLQCDWICTSCQSIIEYGVVNELLYCDCGAAPFQEWEFKCNDSRHGAKWSRYEPNVLKQLLDALEPFEEMNILILGTTGVGKSTWINAFINYLTYESLDEAIEEPTLKWAIPCSFRVPVIANGNFVEEEVKIGSNKLERDGATGNSATQATSVYTVNMGRIRVRLLDTPGIGDTRGMEQDKENLADIFAVLRTYKKLHGILFLLKPNASRLTTEFKYCLKQLLTQLHRNAAKNIAFGFTNTRGFNYGPGDSFSPLQTELRQSGEVKLELRESNVFCFDSESFRYLAAKKEGIDLECLEENRRSWDYSVRECMRLVETFKSLSPHEVRKTVNLNETRNTILQLAEPLALLSQKIAVSIEINKDQIKELHNFQHTREELMGKLMVQKESLEVREVDQPRTVCTNRDCIETRSDIRGATESTTVYRTVCHEPCHLQGVDRSLKGDRLLQRCAAIGAKGMCQNSRCKHHWMDHMHIYYEFQPITYSHRDEAIDRDLLQNANDIEIKEQAIAAKKRAIEEFRNEYRQVQEATAQFAVFIKHSAFAAYNDATVEYIDMLIDQEKLKVQHGGTDKQLKNLITYRVQHLEKVSILDKALEVGDTSKSLDGITVNQLIDSLYKLPHFGKDLLAIVKNQGKAAERMYREQSYSVATGRHTRQQALRAKISQNGVGAYSSPRAGASVYTPVPGTFPREPTGGTISTKSSRRAPENPPPDNWPSFSLLKKRIMGFLSL